MTEKVRVASPLRVRCSTRERLVLIQVTPAQAARSGRSCRRLREAPASGFRSGWASYGRAVTQPARKVLYPATPGADSPGAHRQVPGDETEVSIDIAGDLALATKDGALKAARLRLLVEQLTALDELQFDLNGTTLDPSWARKHLLYNDTWLEFDVSPPLLRQGWNRLSLRVIARNPLVDCRLALASAELLVSYYRAPAAQPRRS